MLFPKECTLSEKSVVKCIRMWMHVKYTCRLDDLFICCLLLSHNSKTSIQCGTGFIGHLPLDGADTVVLVTVNHVLNNMDTALESEFTFQYREEGQGVVVKGKDLFAGCGQICKACPPAMVSVGCRI